MVAFDVVLRVERLQMSLCSRPLRAMLCYENCWTGRGVCCRYRLQRVAGMCISTELYETDNQVRVSRVSLVNQMLSNCWLPKSMKQLGAGLMLTHEGLMLILHSTSDDQQPADLRDVTKLLKTTIDSNKQ